MALNFHQLHIFHTVAEKGSFSHAAQALHMTQPAVTMQVQSLEDYFGTKLFVRSTKRVELTEAGRALLPFASRSISLMKETDAGMARFTHMLEGRLHLGASLTVGEYVLPRLLGPFSQEFPNISVSMKVINTKQILEEVLNHQLTFGLVEAEVHHPDVHTEPVLSDELTLIVPKNHPLAGQETIGVQDLLPYPFVLREQGSGTRRVMEEELARAGCDLSSLKIVMELGSTGAVKSAVEAGLGISVISQSSVKHETALGVLVAKQVEGVSFARSFHAIYLSSTLLPISAVTFLSFLRERDLSQWL
ncbi:selenium metabolism-associated LysR family transcriptional regulator [Paenibacillus mucilaginosus]|uniref:LysR family transcriptional regulator n=2 Tax=Paenibacillus mucilaginosus TaxID=61624 RepID=I0BPP4_9BACL|nr:selenium metabolism-associated LysR family transcriptional regulator [Paenibacillus mucilaginosus]AEI42422.1 transcriptional regulator, LysR family [Paenibacillus mucilaginosus KNP414]AFH64341.1 LysR family transcriptional regulator [Paenibacillus mucilaginosus K02]MCG7213824.1 LysR family transcriptional regulator [Paenibacillus mucilaginosus]WDM25833.1 LysR family transcriptional regulator [Paenibacillus mucilaginosus]WFA20486.1 LysR family transcriptional regulator [Paenibacillus mucilag